MYRRSLVYTVLLFLIFASCSEESAVLVEPEQEYALETLDNGDLLGAGDSVNVALSEMGNRSTSVEIILENRSGEELASTKLDSELFKGLGLPIDLPEDLEDGTYVLRFRILDGDILLHQETRYFYVFEGKFDVIGLETYPPGIKPGDRINAKGFIEYPDDIDPWLRWSLNGDLLLEGYLSDNGTACSFTVPEDEGVYSLQLELFPVMPEEGEVSGISRQSDLFINADEGDGQPWHSSENRTYLYFIDFARGFDNLISLDERASLTGAPESWTDGVNKGYSFGEDDGLGFDDFALSVDGEGLVEDFLLTLAFSFDSLPVSGAYNIFRTGDGDSGFAVYYDADLRVFVCKFHSGGSVSSYDLAGDVLDAYSFLSLEINYDGDAEKAIVSWSNRGQLLAEEEGLSLSLKGTGSTDIGAYGEENGLAMTWYSLGLSSEEESSSHETHQVVVEKKEETLYLREGLPRSIDVEALALGEGLGTLEILCDPEGSKEWTVYLSDPGGRVFYNLAPAQFDATPGDSITISFNNDSRGLFLSSSMDPIMAGPFEYQDSLNLEIIPDTGLPESLADVQALRIFRD